MIFSCRWLSIAGAGFLAGVIVGCGDSNDAVPGDLPTCPAATMRLEGTADGNVIALSQPAGDGGFDQDDGGGRFRTQQARLSGRRDATLIDVDLSWGGSLDLSKSRAATGSTVLPTAISAPLVGVRLCAGEGSQIAMVSEGIRFRLATLTKGQNCDEPIAGEIKGCWSPP